MCFLPELTHSHANIVLAAFIFIIIPCMIICVHVGECKGDLCGVIVIAPVVVR